MTAGNILHDFDERSLIVTGTNSRAVNGLLRESIKKYIQFSLHCTNIVRQQNGCFQKLLRP